MRADATREGNEYRPVVDRHHVGLSFTVLPRVTGLSGLVIGGDIMVTVVNQQAPSTTVALVLHDCLYARVGVMLPI